MRPIVIAGSGPSFLKIDYSRLPKDFDVFRCNQFYLEDKYFLGKKIKGVFFNPEVFKQQYFTLHHLIEKEEYDVEDVYCNFSYKGDTKSHNKALKNFNNCFPNVKNSYLYLEKLPRFLSEDRFYRVFYNQWPTSGIVMLITAIAQGYKEIYLTGIDFYAGGGLDYAFEARNTNIGQYLPQFNKKDYSSLVHSRQTDSAFIHLALKTKGVKLYSISPDSPLSEIVPLAPVREGKEVFEVLPKPLDYTSDLIDLPKKENFVYSPRSYLGKFHHFLIESGLYTRARKNIFFILARDFLFCFKVVFDFIRSNKK